MSDLRQNTLSIRLFRASIVLAAGALLLGTVVAQEIKSYIYVESNTGTMPAQNSVIAFSNDGAVTLLGLFILHTLRRLEDRPLQDNDERLAAKDPASLEVWGGRRRSLLSQAMAQTWAAAGTPFL